MPSLRLVAISVSLPLANPKDLRVVTQMVNERKDSDEILLLVYEVIDSIVLCLASPNLLAYGLAGIKVDTKQQWIVSKKLELILVCIEQRPCGAWRIELMHETGESLIKVSVRRIRDLNPIGHTYS
ncbi:MAG: hypothetical protein ACI361_04185 [Atopobiaceae bacterium]